VESAISALLLECDPAALARRTLRNVADRHEEAGPAAIEEAELVTTEKVGRARRCMLVPYAFEGISTWLQRLDRFAQVVERTKGAR
jgi:hypothetical protein